MTLRLRRFRNLTEDYVTSLRNSFHVELMKLPREVRQMTMKEFCSKYGASVVGVSDKQIRNVRESLLNSPRMMPNTKSNTIASPRRAGVVTTPTTGKRAATVNGFASSKRGAPRKRMDELFADNGGASNTNI